MIKLLRSHGAEPNICGISFDDITSEIQQALVTELSPGECRFFSIVETNTPN